MFAGFMSNLSSVTAPATRFLKAGAGGTPEPKDTDNPFADLLHEAMSGPTTEPEAEDVMYAEYIKNIWEDEYQKTAPTRERARVAWMLFHNQYPADELKDEWQSKKKFPLMAMTVERLVAAISRLLENNPHWFEVNSTVPGLQIYANLSRALLAHWLNHDTVKFTSLFKGLIKSGLLNTVMACQVVFETNGEPMITPSQHLEGTDPAFAEFADLAEFVDNKPGSSSDMPFLPNPTMPKLRLSAIDPMDLVTDSSGSNEFTMWRTYHTAGQLMDFVESRGYDHDACKRAILSGPAPMQMKESESNQRKNQQRGKYSSFAGKVILTHFEGTMTDPENGMRVFRKKYMVVANGEVVLKPQPIGFWDGEGSIVHSNFQDIVHSTSGKSLMTDSLDAFQSRHDLTNLLLDFFQLTLMGMHEMDTDMLDKDEEVPTKMFPGMLIRTKRRGSNPNASAVQPVTMADLPQGFWQFMQFFQQQFGEYTAMTQELMGMPRARGRMTGSEHQSRSSESGALMAHIFEDIEDKFLARILRLAFLRILQDTPDKMWSAWVMASKESIIPKGKADPQLVAQWSAALDDCAKWTAKQRFVRLGSYFKFTVKIFGSVAERQAEIEQMIYLLQNLAKVPSALQMVRMEKFIPELVQRFGIDPESMLNLEAIPVPPDEQTIANNPAMSGEDSQISDVPFDLMGGSNSLFNQALGGMQPQGMPGMLGKQAAPFPGAPTQVAPNQVQPPPGGVM